MMITIAFDRQKHIFFLTISNVKMIKCHVGCCLQSYLNHLTSWHGPVRSIYRALMRCTCRGIFVPVSVGTTMTMTLSHISLETRLTKTDSSHVQEYVWLFAKQSINWQLCIGGVNSEIEITHTYFSNGQNISTLQMYSKILVRLHSSFHIYHILWYFYLDVLGGQFKLHTNEEVHPISPLLEIIRIISQELFI